MTKDQLNTKKNTKQVQGSLCGMRSNGKERGKVELIFSSPFRLNAYHAD